MPNTPAKNTSNIDEALADVEKLTAVNSQGKLECLGNWSAGQNLGHLATWVDYWFDGVPMKVPFILRLILGPMKKRMLYKPMPAGSKIPGVPGGTLAYEPYSFEEGAARFRRSYARLKAEAP